MLAISRLKNNDDKSVQTLLMALFDNISCPQLQISERLIYFEVLKEFSLNYQTGNMVVNKVLGLF